jgi:branched-subunit amino acid ABC-type transport system permease component
MASRDACFTWASGSRRPGGSRRCLGRRAGARRDAALAPQLARGGSAAAPRLLPDVLAPRLGLFGDERPQQRDALIVVFYALLVAVILWYVLEWTPMGRHLRATGSGREAARLTGVRTDKWLFLSFVMSGAIAALAGFMQTSRVGSAPPDIGANFLLPA